MLPAGTYNLGPQQGRLVLRVNREGLAKKVGHDLVLEVRQWNATVEVGDDPSRSSVTATADTRTFEVVEGSGGVKALSDGDRADILKNINEKVLKTRQYPEISFRSTSVQPQGPNRATVSGDLTIMGNTRPATFDFNLDGSSHARASTTIKQTDFGIKPFSALMGALKIKDSVDIEVDANVNAR